MTRGAAKILKKKKKRKEKDMLNNCSTDTILRSNCQGSSLSLEIFIKCHFVQITTGSGDGKDEPGPAPAVPESNLSHGRFWKEVNVGRGEMKGGLEQSGGLLQAAAELKCVS